jgi:hypothetical protein
MFTYCVCGCCTSGCSERTELFRFLYVSDILVSDDDPICMHAHVEPRSSNDKPGAPTPHTLKIGDGSREMSQTCLPSRKEAIFNS